MREIYSYDLLGLRNIGVVMIGTATGRLMVHETVTGDSSTNGQVDEITGATVVENHLKGKVL